MRDSYMTELEDIVWSDYDQIDDHVVPHPHQRQDVRSVYQGDSLKTHQYVGAGVSDNVADCHANMYVNKGKGERRVQQFMNSKDIVLEEDLWSRSAEGLYPALHDNESNEATTNLASDNTKISNQYFNNRNTDSAGTDLSTDDLVISEGCGAVETESYDYRLSDIIQADNDLSFCEDKESNDLLYYGWPNIGNFEDVDRIFSNCDSTFGLGNAGNEDELNWFSSSHNTIDGSGNVLKSAFQFPCPDSSTFNTIPEEDSSLKMDNMSSFVNDANVNDSSLSYRSMSEALKDGGDADTIGGFTFTNESEATYESNGQSIPMQKGNELNGFVAGGISTANHSKNEKYGMISFQKKQVKHRNKSEGKRKDRDLEKSSSNIRRSNLRSDRITMSSIHSSLRSPDTRKQKKSMSTTNTLAFPHTGIPYTSPDYISRPGQIPVLSTASAVKSHSSSLTTLPPNDSSNDSTHLRSMESLQRWPVDVSSIPVNGRNVSLQSQRGYYPSYPGTPVQVDLVVQTGDPISDPMQVQHAQRETENQNEIEGARVGTLEDADTSQVQGSSCMSSGLDEITQEASSFRQLQQVMEQLDIRTKLCIRDSLYRLARSAEQRHPYAMLGSNGGNDQDPNGAEAEGRHSGFLNIETDTNPIDRSIAHLLFHRPSDTSVTSVPDDIPLESNSMVQGSLTSPPVITTEKLARNEQTIGEKANQ